MNVTFQNLSYMTVFVKYKDCPPCVECVGGMRQSRKGESLAKHVKVAEPAWREDPIPNPYLNFVSLC